MPRMRNTKDTKIGRCLAYFELDLYTLVQKDAAERDMSLSNYIRMIAIERLAADGKISNEQLLKLAVHGS